MSRLPQPPLSELLDRYLRQQAAAHASGLALPEPLGEVVPHDAAPAQPVDPRTAWNESLTALHCWQEITEMAAPPDWPTLVVTHEPESALAFAVGNFPQLIRNLLPLWQTKDLTTLCPRGSAAVPVPTLVEWATETLRQRLYPQGLVALGAVRLARQFAVADELIRSHATQVPTAWRAAWANEQAALAWHNGQGEQAAEAWGAQSESVSVLFNRGMAALFLGRPEQARTALSKAVTQLPDHSAWHHLGRLYLALAEIAR